MLMRAIGFLNTAFLPKQSRATVVDLLALWRSRRALSRLDAQGRADIGRDALACEREASRPIWDVPEHWVD